MLKIVNLCITNQNKNKFLFLKRNKHPFKNYLGMLGGKIENQEDPSKAASRELFEEAGISSSGKFLGKCHEKIIENKQVIAELEIYFFYFIINESTKFNSGHEGELKWISIDDFKNNKLIPSDPLMINAFLNKGVKGTISIIEKIEEEYFQTEFEEVLQEKPDSKKPGVGVGVMILKNGKILLGKRHPDKEEASGLKEAGTWTMPGGKLDFQESFEECAKRETLEECGIKLNKVKVMCINNDKNEHAHFITIGLFSDDFEGEPKVIEPDKITEWSWFDLNNLPYPLFSPTKKMLDNYKENKFCINP